jgi:hypothetical protein
MSVPVPTTEGAGGAASEGHEAFKTSLQPFAALKGQRYIQTLEETMPGLKLCSRDAALKGQRYIQTLEKLCHA